jgi:hypothetical protein
MRKLKAGPAGARIIVVIPPMIAGRRPMDIATATLAELNALSFLIAWILKR